ncbi:unnamed protein product [Diamesa serratosioi]
MPDVKMSYSLDFEFPHDIEHIAREQGEHPDTKVAIMQEFKDLIYERGECNPHRMDDDFLIKFLRARFWKVDNAYKLLCRYFVFREANSSWIKGVQPLTLLSLGEDDIVSVAPYRDQNGMRMLIYKIGGWKPSKNPMDELFKATLILMEIGSLEPRAQILGGIGIFDLEGLSLTHTWHMSPSVAQKIISIMVTCMPYRSSAIHVVNQNWVFDAVYHMFKPFLNEQMRARIFFHGNNWSSLHKHIDPENLPKKYGGVHENHSYKLWIDYLSNNEYVVSELEKQQYSTDPKQVEDKKAEKLFELYCEIEKKEDGSKNIIKKFPDNYKTQEILQILKEFAFPCDFEVSHIQSFSFVLTNITSDLTFGFCRHDASSNVAILMISYFPWHDVFLKFLNVLAEVKKNDGNQELERFLIESYKRRMSEEKNPVRLTYGSGMNTFLFHKPNEYFELPSIPENHNLNLFYNYVEPKNMIGIFAALMTERRIIFTSKNLDKLSSCVQASNSLLFPLVWQHIYIPILPMKIKDTLSAPMPYLCGVPEAVFKTMRRDEIGEVVIYNCDSNVLESPFDDIVAIPHEILNTLKKQLNHSSTELRGNRISKIFLSALVQLIGGYRDAIKFTNDVIRFDNDTFIESRPHKAFLSKMVTLQIFQQFIDERLYMIKNGGGLSDEFEIEIVKHAERNNKKLSQYKDFFKNVKTKANPTMMKNAVKSVKGTYKDIKSKMKDQPPLQQIRSDSHTGFKTYGSSLQLRDNESPSSSNSNPRQSSAFEKYSWSSNSFNDSPLTTSPSSSSSSSDMNILQEIQSQGLLLKYDLDNSNDDEDLIKLNDSLSLDDFDPISNRVSTSSRKASTPGDVDDLLRGYGLDQFNLNSSTKPNNETTTGSNNGFNNWTKFE